MNDDPLLSLQERSADAVRRISEMAEATPMAATIVGLVESNVILLGILKEMTQTLPPDERSVALEAVATAQAVLAATSAVANATI